MDNARHNATHLYSIADLVSFYHRLEEEKICSEMQDHLRAAIVCGLTEFAAGFKLITSGKLTKVEKQEPVVETEPKAEVEEVEQPKRRARKKKVVEAVVEQPENEEPVAEERQPGGRRELVFKKGLDKEMASFSTIEDVDDDKIVNENLGPIPLANSLPKQGEHPFFKGPAQFVWYLPMDRWPLYLADLLEERDHYPDQLSLYDAKRLEEAKKVGVDIEFVTSIINKESKRMVSIEDFKEADYADDDASLESLKELKENGFLKKFVETVDPEKRLLKFLSRNGWNKGIVTDLETIYEEHTEHPNKYIHW